MQRRAPQGVKRCNNVFHAGGDGVLGALDGMVGSAHVTLCKEGKLARAVKDDPCVLVAAALVYSLRNLARAERVGVDDRLIMVVGVKQQGNEACGPRRSVDLVRIAEAAARLFY